MKQITVNSRWAGKTLFIGKIKVAYYFAGDNAFVVHSPVTELIKFNGKVNSEKEARQICKEIALEFIKLLARIPHGLPRG